MTAQQLAERCAEWGAPIHRTTITKIENGRPRFDLGELMVLAFALDTSPMMLVFPDLADGPIELMPGREAPSASGLLWFSGERFPRGRGRLYEEHGPAYELANKPVKYVREFVESAAALRALSKHSEDLGLADDVVRREILRLHELLREMRAAGLVVRDDTERLVTEDIDDG